MASYASGAFINKQYSIVKKIDEFRKYEIFFQCIENGSEEDLKKAKQILEQDDKQFLHDTTSDFHLVNKPNEYGQTPLYVACKNGHLKMVRFLVNEGAKMDKESMLTDGKIDSNLGLAIRWHHTKLVDYLLTSFEWTSS